MAIAQHELNRSKVLTYDDYMTEGVVEGSYAIINGVREFMTSPVPDHQSIVGNVLFAFKIYEDHSGDAFAFNAQSDVLISRQPLQVRQPDVFLISRERWGDRLGSVPGALSAPELVVEVLPPSDTRSELQAKLDDFNLAGVNECWIVSAEAATVEVLTFDGKSSKRLNIYGIGDSVTSVSFQDLTVEINKIFKFATPRSQ